MQLVWTKPSLPLEPMETEIFWMRRAQLGIVRTQERWTTMERWGGRGGSAPSLRLCMLETRGVLTSLPQGEMGYYELPECGYSEENWSQCSPAFENPRPYSLSRGLSHPWRSQPASLEVAMLAAGKVDTFLWVMLSAVYVRVHIHDSPEVPQCLTQHHTGRTQLWNQNGICHV